MRSDSKHQRVATLSVIAVFVVSFVLLFLSMSRRPGIHDEGFMVTGAMRIIAGQVPHRDFYVNYGPAQFYILAGLFKVFGQYLIVERLYDVFTKAALLAVFFAIVSSFCRRTLALGAYCAAFLWVASLTDAYGNATQPVNVLDLVSAFLIMPVLAGYISKRRLLFLGMLAGISTLFRYDTGIALAGLSVIVFLISALVSEGSFAARAKAFAKMTGIYLSGCMIVVIPALVYFLSIAPIHGFLFDIFEYPAKNYHRGRNLPFPTLRLHHLGDLGVYIPIVIALIALFVALGPSASKGNRFTNLGAGFRHDSWWAFLFVFGLTTFAMYFKGWVRASPWHMYLSIIPSVLLIAVLLQHSSQLSGTVRGCVLILVTLSIIAPIGSTLSEGRHRIAIHDTLASSGIRDAEQRAWCETPGALTKGVCFIPRYGRTQLIQFLDTHTTPDQTILVANTHNDIVFASDSMMYFAAGRMPETHWAEFDPGLQNSVPIQMEMMHELDVKKSRYIVLDSEFDTAEPEPNDSSRSSGVFLLDNYIHSKYANVATFDEFTIWQRIDDASKLSSNGRGQ
jgi:hypothetical protein